MAKKRRDDFDVGFRRPPKASQFQPGQSGNPRGRPKGVRSLADMIRKILGRTVTVTENGRTRRIPRIEAMLLRVVADAMRGNPQALRLLLQLTERYGEGAQANADREELATEDLDILRRYLPDPEVTDSRAAGPQNNQHAADG